MQNKQLRKFILLLLVLTSTLKVLSTEQIPDLLILGKDTVYMNFFPLEKLSFKTPPFKFEENFVGLSSGCWRGYQAIWKIEDNKLFLLEIIINDSIKTKINIEQYFIENGYKPYIQNEMIFADWYSTNREYLYKTFKKSVVVCSNRKCLFDFCQPEEKRILVRIKSGSVVKLKL